MAARLDLLCERYAKYDLFHEWFVKQPSFIGWFHGHLARVATVRFAVGSLARLRGLTEVQALDALAVEVVYLFTRAVAHIARIVAEMLRELERHGMRLEHAVSLIRV